MIIVAAIAIEARTAVIAMRRFAFWIVKIAIVKIPMRIAEIAWASQVPEATLAITLPMGTH
jgi:hypothetical protein